MSPVALVGGNEFRRDCEAMDRALLGVAGGAGARVVILPTAATNENPHVAGASGARYWRRLGARAESLLIVDAESAANPALAAEIDKAQAVYLTSGDPIYLLETLRGSPAWEAIVSLHRRDGLVIGSSAGAMVLGGQMWNLDRWTDGLALAPQLAVLPHHATLSVRWDAARLARDLPAGVTLVGVDETTALLLPEGRVMGAGAVSLYGKAGVQAYEAPAVIPPFPQLTAG
jgi:cyanophycinase